MMMMMMIMMMTKNNIVYIHTKKTQNLGNYKYEENRSLLHVTLDSDK